MTLDTDKGRFRFRKMVDGKRYTIYLKTSSEKEALKQIDTISAMFIALSPKEAYTRAVQQFSTEKGSTDKQTLVTLIKNYIELKSLATRNILNYETLLSNVRDFLKFKGLQDINISELDKQFCSDYLVFLSQKSKIINLEESNLKKSTIKRYFKYFKSVLDYGIEIEWLEKDITGHIKLGRTDPAPLVYLTFEELERLLKACDSYEERKPRAKKLGKTLKRMFLMYSKTGLRKQELLNLTWDDINLESRTIKVIPKMYTVNGQELEFRQKSTEGSIPINKSLMVVLLEMKKEDDQGLLFKDPKTGGKIKIDLVNAIKCCGEIAGIKKNLTIHKLRHTTATHLREMGVGIETVKEILRHANIKETLRYAHVGNAESQKAIDQI